MDQQSTGASGCCHITCVTRLKDIQSMPFAANNGKGSRVMPTRVGLRKGRGCRDNVLLLPPHDL